LLLYWRRSNEEHCEKRRRKFMRNTSSAARSETGVNVVNRVAPARRSIADLLAPLDQLVKDSPNLIVNREARFDVEGESYVLPRYLFIGPKSGDAPIRI